MIMPADNSFITADCLDVLRDMPDKAVDLCLTDPPYGIGEDGGKNRTRLKHRRHIYHPKLYWDANRPSKTYFDNINRISLNQIIWGGNYFVDYLKPSMGWIYWDKQMGGDFSDGELAYTSFDKALKAFSHWNERSGFFENYHPTQKPVALFVWCLENYSNPGDLILDPFCGSGTTAIACHRTGRRFICIDKEQAYIDIAKRRYAEAVAQGNLFDKPVPDPKQEALPL
jgi:site-specific DNA-methyltransferase (adenine-specific)